MARAPSLLALSLLAVGGSALAQQEPAQPPGSRTFGRDHTSTGVFTGAGVVPVGLACDDDPGAPAPDPATPRSCHGFLASFDGTLLETTVSVPRESTVAHPLVVAMHGWGGSQGSTAKYEAPLIEDGFAVLRYSARGFGGSFGQTNLADVDVEGADLRSLVGQVVDDPRLLVNPKAVAVFGASYGGAHAWLGAVTPAFESPQHRAIEIRTAIPVASWTDLLDSLAPNGRPEQAHEIAGAEKLSYVQAFFFGGIRARLDRPYPNYPEYLPRWNIEMTTNEVPYAATPTGREVVDGLQGYRSAYWQEPFWARVRANRAAGLPQLPIFAVQGFTDDLFPIREAVRMYDALRAIDAAYPIALYLGDVGHPRAVNKTGEVDYLFVRVREWLRWYLSGSGTQPPLDVQAAITRAADVAFSSADVIRVPTCADLSTANVTARFRRAQVITFDPANRSGFQWDPLLLAACGQLDPCPPAPPSLDVPGDVAAYEVAVSSFTDGSLLVAGEPTVTLWALSLSHRVQLDVRMLDVSPEGVRRLVTRGTFTVDTGIPGRPIGARRVAIPTFGNLWEVPAGHTLRFEVTNVDAPYLRPSLVPSVTLLINVEVSVPVRE